MFQPYYLFYIIYFVLIILIYRHEFKKYDTNIPYKFTKKKNSFFYRLFLGILGGIHYSHFIGNYSHKKYNTQVFTPKTFECYVAGIVASAFLIGYPIIASYLSQIVGTLGFFIMLIPIILNLVSILKS